MNKKFVKENKTLVREFISALISSIVAGKLSKGLEKKLMSNPETKKEIQKLKGMKKELNKRLDASISNLRDRFAKINASGKKRDIGALAEDKPKLIQRVINKGTKNALRCMEISMGSPLRENEKNATKKSEINPECPELANPSYQPYGG